MSLTDFDKELIATNLLGATTLKELHQKEKIVTNAKMLALQNEPVVGAVGLCSPKKYTCIFVCRCLLLGR